MNGDNEDILENERVFIVNMLCCTAVRAQGQYLPCGLVMVRGSTQQSIGPVCESYPPHAVRKYVMAPDDPTHRPLW